MRRVILLVNPLLAARGKRRVALERCAELLRSTSCAVELADTLPGDRAAQQAREAIEAGFDTIFVCGGDGTFFHALQGVAGSQAALGVIPLGTGNVLAQNLKLPRDPLAALRVQCNADAISIPLGEVVYSGADGREQSWYFTIAAGVGFHAALMGLSPNGKEKQLWGRAAYFTGGIRLLATRAVQPVEVEMHGPRGESHQFRAAELLAVRVPMINRWRAGGDLSSPLLRVASVPESGRLGLAHACFRAFFLPDASPNANNHHRLPHPRYDQAIQVACDGGETPLPIQADGELLGSGRAVFKMSEKRARLLWPNLKR